jgi:hypothetical protein
MMQIDFDTLAAECGYGSSYAVSYNFRRLMNLKDFKDLPPRRTKILIQAWSYMMEEPEVGLSFGIASKDLRNLIGVCFEAFSYIDCESEHDLYCSLKFSALHLRVCRWGETILPGDIMKTMVEVFTDVEVVRCSLDNINHGMMRTAKFSSHSTLQDAADVSGAARDRSTGQWTGKFNDMTAQKAHYIRSNIEEHLARMSLIDSAEPHDRTQLIGGNTADEPEVKPTHPSLQRWKLEIDAQVEEMIEGL